MSAKNTQKFLVMIATLAVALMTFAFAIMATALSEADAAQPTEVTVALATTSKATSKVCPGAHRYLRDPIVYKKGLTLQSYRRAFYCVVNAERAASGLAPYQVSKKTEKAAQCHASFMVQQRDYTSSHTEPPPAPCGKYDEDRMSKVGWDFSLLREGAGPMEAIYGSMTPYDVVRAFLGSPGHCYAVLARSADMMGVGAATSRKGSMAVFNLIDGYHSTDQAAPPCPRKMRTNAAPFVKIVWAKRQGKRLTFRLKTNAKRKIAIVVQQPPRWKSRRVKTLKLNAKPQTVTIRLPRATNGSVLIGKLGIDWFQ